MADVGGIVNYNCSNDDKYGEVLIIDNTSGSEEERGNVNVNGNEEVDDTARTQ